MPDTSTVRPDPHPDDAIARYLAATGPIYRMLTTLVGQMSLLLLLSADRRLGQARAATAQTLAKESEAALATLAVPAAAGRHHWLLSQALDRLSDVLRRLRRGRMDVAASTRLIRLVRSAHELLRLAALPEAGLSLADLRRACCSCVR
jgi:hypothetical protein